MARTLKRAEEELRGEEIKAINSVIKVSDDEMMMMMMMVVMVIVMLMLEVMISGDLIERLTLK